MNLKPGVIFETIVIIALAAILILEYPKAQLGYLHSEGKVGLLSPRVYADILQPGSYLILN